MLKTRFTGKLGLTCARAGLICALTTLAAGCTVAVRPALPPPVYVAPPPVAMVAPAPAVEVQVNEAPPPLPVTISRPARSTATSGRPVTGAMGPAAILGARHLGAPPRVGVLWTPGYWGWIGGVYAWNAGYWGPHIGFYGGVNYGFGYVGNGYDGGRWEGGHSAYNRAVNNVNVTVIHNIYTKTVVNNVTVNRVSFNGGAGARVAAPSAQERMAAQEPHVAATALQQQHAQEAAKNPALFAKRTAAIPRSLRPLTRRCSPGRASRAPSTLGGPRLPQHRDSPGCTRPRRAARLRRTPHNPSRLSRPSRPFTRTSRKPKRADRQRSRYLNGQAASGRPVRFARRAIATMRRMRRQYSRCRRTA